MNARGLKEGGEGRYKRSEAARHERVRESGEMGCLGGGVWRGKRFGVVEGGVEYRLGSSKAGRNSWRNLTNRIRGKCERIKQMSGGDDGCKVKWVPGVGNGKRDVEGENREVAKAEGGGYKRTAGVGGGTLTWVLRGRRAEPGGWMEGGVGGQRKGRDGRD
jgi:hypothetical protein